MGKHSRDSDRRYDRDHGRSGGSRSVEREISAVKKNMRDKLNTAITDIKRMEQTAEPEQSSKGYTLTVADTLKRNTQINQIEEAGFTPAAFISKRGGKKDQIEQKHDDHESAVFGPMWKSKELAKKLEKQEKKPVVQLDLNSIPMPSEVDTNFDDFPLAKQWLDINPEERKKRWLETFLEQRRQLYDGEL